MQSVLGLFANTWGPAVGPLSRWRDWPRGSEKGMYSSRTCPLVSLCRACKGAWSYLLHESLGKTKAIFLFFSPSSFFSKHWANLIQGIKNRGKEYFKLCVPILPLYLCRCLVCSFLYYFSLSLIVALSIRRGWLKMIVVGLVSPTYRNYPVFASRIGV